jgi:predicted membrane channel-forming protein YqfA (hemolysin III family)
VGVKDFVQRTRCELKEPFCGLSHLVGVVLSGIALVVLLLLAWGRPWHRVSFAIYGASRTPLSPGGDR